MCLRVTMGRFSDPSKEDAINRWANDTLIPALRRLPGFHSYQGAVNRADMTIAAVSVWDTEEQAMGLRDAVASGVLQTLSGLGVTLDAGQVYEITVDTSA